MKVIERLRAVIDDERRDIRERLYILFTIVGVATLLIISIVGLFIGEHITDLLAMFGGTVLFFLIFLYSVKRNRIRQATNLMAAVIVFVVLPFTFFTGGGTNSGMPMWFIFVMLLIVMLLQGGIRRFFVISEILVMVACYLIEYTHPEWVTIHQGKKAYMDSYISFLIISVIMVFMLSFQIMIFRKDNAKANRQRLEIEKLNQRQNQFFSSMSHEIRTPINTIIGLNEMILKEDISAEVADDAINMQSAGKTLLSLINDILDMSKIESGKMEITPVQYSTGDMLSDIVSMIWIRAREKELEFHIEVDPMLPAELIGDEVRIKQVLINVLTNAVKYTNQGSITLSMRCESTEDDTVTVIYTVEDTGIGIKRESMPYLFSTFKRVGDERLGNRQGTGLGLALVKQFVELMGGSIKVNSVYTQGTTFFIEIPQKKVDNSVIGEVDIEKRHALNRRSHFKRSFKAPKAMILAVDDTPANLMVLKKLLRDTEVNIDTATSGAMALEMCAKKEYHVIFMDHMMPGMDGIECLHRIREQEDGKNKEPKVVALTANDGSASKSLYRKEGFNGYLVKPIDSNDMGNLLLSLLPDSIVEESDADVDAIEEKVTRREAVKKTSVLITTESVCDLPVKYTKEQDIPVIPYYVCNDTGIFLDGIEADSQEIVLYIMEGRGMGYSEPPSIDRYEAFFAEQLRRADYIIHISMAKNVGVGFKRSTEAAGSFDNVTVLDSGHLSSGMGLVVMEANRLAKEGMSAPDILKALQAVMNRINTSFIVDSTDFLSYTGRINKGVANVARNLMIHPVLRLRHSSMGVSEIYIGSREKTYKKYIDRVFNPLVPVDKSILFITYVGMSAEELEMIEKEVTKKHKFDRVIYQKACPSVASNCGPGTFGLIFKSPK